MSWCRFSSMDWKCDLYIFESDRGIETYVASSRHMGPIPTTPFILDVPIEEFAKAHRLQMGALDSTNNVPIGGPHDGAHFIRDTEEEQQELLVCLRAAGYVFPDDLLELAAVSEGGV